MSIITREAEAKLKTAWWLKNIKKPARRRVRTKKVSG